MVGAHRHDHVRRDDLHRRHHPPCRPSHHSTPARRLHLGLQWIINSYLLALTALVLAAGRIGDIFGHRRIFCIGLLLFAAASALCGLSTQTFQLIGSRFVQGCGEALLLPATSSILQETFAPNQRGRALGIMIGIGSLFLTLGPFVGGLLTQYLSWRYAFWINLPIAFFRPHSHPMRRHKNSGEKAEL